MGLPRAPFKDFFFKKKKKLQKRLREVCDSYLHLKGWGFPPSFPHRNYCDLPQTRQSGHRPVASDTPMRSVVGKLAPRNPTAKKENKKNERVSEQGISQFLAMQNQSNPPGQGCRNVKPQDAQPRQDARRAGGSACRPPSPSHPALPVPPPSVRGIPTQPPWEGQQAPEQLLRWRFTARPAISKPLF